MTNCCSESCDTVSSPKKSKCPACGKKYNTVSEKTILYHIKDPWNWPVKHQAYYYCETPECTVVYFGEDASVIKKSELRTIVGIKEKPDAGLICYCFGVTKKQAANNKEAATFVLNKTKEQSCACETHNPSGKCCLKNFPKT